MRIGTLESGAYSASYPDRNVTTSFQYNAKGQLWKKTDTLGYVTEYQYDSLGRLEKQINPDPDGDPATTGDIPVTSYEYNRQNQVLTVTDPRNQVTTYEYL